MSDLAKWGLLVAGAAVVIALIFGMFAGVGTASDFVSTIGYLVNIFVEYASDYLKFGRALVNNFVLPGTEVLLTFALVYLISRWFLHISIKIIAWIYHYIFK